MRINFQRDDVFAVILVAVAATLAALPIALRGCGGDGSMMPVHAAELQKKLPYNPVDCDNANGNPERCTVEPDEPTATYRTSGGMALPDADVTPGAVDPEVEADTTGASFVVDGIEKNICAPHFSARAIRKTIKNFPRLKRVACERYGVTACDASVEGDHLISIELGGCPDCQENVWPEPMSEARIKDHQVEDVLPKLVCSGRMSLAEAQQCVATDWVACRERIQEK